MKAFARTGAILLLLTSGLAWSDVLIKFGFDSISEQTLTIACCVLFMVIYLVKKDDSRTLCQIFWPMALNLLWIFLPFPRVSAIFLAGTSALTVYRWLAAGYGPNIRWPQKYALPLTIALSVTFCTAGIAASIDAYQKMFLIMSDWGLYTQTALNTWHGQVMHGTWPVANFSEGHFMPGFFFLFAPVYGLLPSPYTAFVAVALLLWGSALLLYLLARKVGLTPWQSCGCSVVWLLYPSVSNMNLCMFYGFNAVLLFIPVFVLFYLCDQKGYYKTAFAIFLYSLLIKETIGVFWFGWGCVAFIEGRRKTGIAYAAIGAASFLLASKVIIPAFAPEGYIFYAQYGSLGNGIFDIMLSPVMRPEAFWSQILRLNNLFFVVMILLPVFPSALNRPWLLLAGSLIVVFNFLRGSEMIVNIIQQYQTENIIMLAVAMILGLQKAAAGQRWPKWLGAGLPKPDTATVKRAMLGGTLAAAATCHIFYAEAGHTLNRYQMMQPYQKVDNLAAEMKQIVPPDVPLAADQVTAPQFLFRNPLHGLAYQDSNYKTFGLGHYVNPNPDDLRAIVNSDEWELKWHKHQNLRSFYVYQRVGRKTEIPPKLPVIPPSDFLRNPNKIKTNSPYDDIFAIRAERKADSLQISICQLKPFDKFIGFWVTAADQNGNIYEEQKFFGNALTPPEKIPPFSVDTMTIPLPADAQIQNIAVKPVLL